MLYRLCRIPPEIRRLFTHAPKLQFLTETPLCYTTSATCRAQDPSIDTAYIKENNSAKSGETRASPKFRVKADERLPRRKLHNRALSDHEKSQNEELARIVSDLPRDERYGVYAAGVRREKRQKAKAKRPPSETRNLGPRREGVVDDGDVFGSMASEEELQLPGDVVSESRAEEFAEDDSDEEHIPLSEYGLKGCNARWYAKRIEELGKEGKVYEAIQMLEEKMLREDRVAPNEHVFTAVIGILGRVGYTMKAFQLFNQMKKYGVIPAGPTYTALFNSCANSPWREDGFKRANDLCLLMIEKGVEPNSLTIKAMVKAYGKLGEIETAFSIVDRMVEAGQKLDQEAWSHLLIACISDKETGLKHAIEVWRKMRRKSTPNIYHYNLLLRAARDCGLGESDYANQLIGGSTSHRKLPEKDSSPPSHKSDKVQHLAGDESSEISRLLPARIALDSGEDMHLNECIETDSVKTIKDKVSDLENKGNSLSKLVRVDKENLLPEASQSVSILGDAASPGPSIFDMNVPNILNPRGIGRHQIVSLGNLQTPQSRLALLGGVPGILSHMKRDKAGPDIKTFSQMLDMIPPVAEAEEDLLAVMNTHGVRPDEDLLHSLIRRRCNRRDLESAKDVLDLFSRLRLTPNLMTFASLALGCTKYVTGLKLLQDIQMAGFVPTVDIFAILIRRSGFDFRYKKALCVIMEKENVAVSEAIINIFEENIDQTRKAIVRKEKGLQVDRHFLHENLPETFKTFMLFYKPWLRRMKLNVPAHPWSQFKTASPDNKPGGEME